MKKIFDGYLLVSDMDGTLISSDHTISEANIKALKYFTENGGIFTVASGRMIDAVNVFYSYIPVNAPVIVHNGAKIYDFKASETLFDVSIEEDRKSAPKKVSDLMPELGIEIYADEAVYVYKNCPYTKRFEGKKYTVHYSVSDDVFEKSWTKVLYIGDSDLLDKYEKIYTDTIDSGYTVRSGANFLDMVSGEASKGKALKKLSEILGIDRAKVIAIGDNMNDVDMIEFAGVGFAVDNASQELKKKADYITPDCDSDALDFVVQKLSDILKGETDELSKIN